MQHARIFSLGSAGLGSRGANGSEPTSTSARNRVLLRLLDTSTRRTGMSTAAPLQTYPRSNIENTLIVGRSMEASISIGGGAIRPNVRRNLTASGTAVGGLGGGIASHASSNAGPAPGSANQPTTPGNTTIGIQQHQERNTEPMPVTVWFHDIRTSTEDVVIDSKPMAGVQDGDICELVPFLKNGEKKRKLVFKVKCKNSGADASAIGGLVSELSATPDSSEGSVASSAGIPTQTTPTTLASNGTGGSIPSTPILAAANTGTTQITGSGSATTTATTTPSGTGPGAVNVKSNFQVSLLANPLQTLMDLPPRLLAHINVVDPASVEVDTVEISIKDICLTRDSMWSFSLQLVGTCVYSDKRLDFLSSRCGVVKSIYKNGRKLFSGYISDKTNVTFRSESSKLVFLVQISREMWHFEETGEVLFHKLVNSLFPKIFQKWRDKNTHHSITIVLFTSVDLTSVPWTSFGQGERPSGRRDFFRVVVDQVNIFHWDRIMANLRIEFANFKQDIMLKMRQSDQHFVLEGDSLPSVKGNLLEAINVAITLVSDRFGNIDLKHSLTHFVVITPGTGLFDVDYDLMAETSRKMLSLDCSLDIVCLSQPPLHIVPLFRFKDSTNNGAVTHCVPNWCDISFFKDLSLSTSQWIPRCKIYELQMMGVMENEVNELEIERFHFDKRSKTIMEAMDRYDQDVFNPVKKETTLDKQVSRKPQPAPAPHTSSLKMLIAELNDSENILEVLPPPKPKVEDDAVSVNSLPSLLGYASLSLIWNKKNANKPGIRSTSATKSDASVTAVGTVTKPLNGGDSAALNTLYSLRNNKIDLAGTASPAFNHKSRSSSPLSRSVNNLVSKRSFRHIPKSSRDYISQPRMISKEELYSPTELELELGTSPQNESRLQRKKSRAGSQITIIGSPPKERGADGNNDHGSGDNSKASKSSPSDLLWNIIANPSKEMHSDILGYLRCSRWNGVFPPKIKRRQVKWRSFQSPAALPIITNIFPSAKELELNYTFQLYDVVLSPDNRLYLETTKDLFREMIHIRLALGFQVCYGDSVNVAEQERINGGNPECLIKYFNPQVGGPTSCYGNIIYLSHDDEIHRLHCDFNGNLNVQLYRHDKKITTTKALGITNYSVKPYVPLIRTRYTEEYSPPRFDAIKTSPKKYNWNQFDQLIAGFDDAMADTDKSFHRMKFVVMPAELPKNAFHISNERLSDEEIRMEGLRKLIAMIVRGKYTSSEPKKFFTGRSRNEIVPEISFYTGSLYEYLVETDPDHVNGVSDRRELGKKGSYSKKDIDLRFLATDLQASALGLNLVDRTWHFKVHKQCFIGNEFVTWLVENFRDIDTREDGTEFGKELMKKGLFKHVENRHDFLDGYYFYELEDEYKESSRRSWFTNRTASVTSTSSTLDPVGAVGSDAPPLGPADSNSSTTNINNSGVKEPKRFMASSSIEFNMDPLKKSYKPEVVTVHYDTVHNPEHCYHIRLQWLNNTTKFIDETINNWSRFCLRHGLKLVETPWTELCSMPEVNPFHSIVDLSLDLNPWEVPEFKLSGILEVNKFYFHFYLLKISGFLLDNRAPGFLRKGDIKIAYSWGEPVFKYAQYIHRTGTYIVELRDNGDLYLAPNNVHLTRQRTMLGAIPDNDINLKLYTHDAQKVMLDFRKTCTDKKRLREIFAQAKNDWEAENFSSTNL